MKVVDTVCRIASEITIKIAPLDREFIDSQISSINST